MESRLSGIFTRLSSHDLQVTERRGRLRGEMSNSARKVRRGDKQAGKPRGNHSQASHDLRRLRSLLGTSRPSEVAALSHSKSSRSQSPHKDTQTHVGGSDAGAEAAELEKFSVTHREQRCFSSDPLHKLFSDILESLVKNRLCSEWMDQAPPEWALRVLVCLRLLIRDPQLQKDFHRLQGVTLLAEHLESVAALHVSCDEPEFAVQTLVTMTYMFQKLSAAEGQRVWVTEAGAHRTLVKLLSTTEGGVLLGALLALTTLAEGPEAKEEIGELPIVENLLVILQEYDLMSKRVSAELLRLLCSVPQVREQLKQLDGLPVLLGLLHGRDLKLLWSVSWVLVQLCQDSDPRAEIRRWGGVPLLLRLLNSDTRFVSNRLSVEKLSSANAAGRVPREEEAEPGQQEAEHDAAALQAACCTALTELSLDDTSAHHIVQENGICTIAKLILQPRSGQSSRSLQCYAFRALRFLFSVERNRHFFKRLFPTDLFELFIDVGHYVRDLAAYQGLQTTVSRYTEEELDGLRDGISAVDQNRPALRLINGYSILEHLGSGAFGSVFKVSKQTGQNLLALKEINLHNPAFGKDKRSRESSVEAIISELSIIKEQMIHPNIVKYYKTFVEGQHLYIVMELIQGVPLAEHLGSLREKQQRFTEDRIWSVFIQLCLALRYLHEEKRIVHRDLTPNNIMLGEEDRVTITDFGLAKQKQENSKLTSVVGTILYSCPEVVKNEPYGEKADVWALGCVLYQMATLQPPFYSSNMLTLASKIVEAVYEPIEEGWISQRLQDMIRWCLSPDADERPDIVAVGSRISDLVMRHVDALYASHNALERRAERDRKRAQKYFLERHKNRPGCCCCCSAGTREGPAARLGVTVDAASQQVVSAGLKSPAVVTPACDFPGEDSAAARLKPRPASSGICVSQRQLRQIDDPTHRLLLQIHKIVYITQLPPASQLCVRRRVIERFKRSLFGSGSDPQSLKAELSKLVQASPELMDFGSSAAAAAHKDGNLRDGVTYEQMQVMIEELLEESSYHQATPGSVSERRKEEKRSDRRPHTSS